MPLPWERPRFFFHNHLFPGPDISSNQKKSWLCFALPWGGVTPISRPLLENGRSTINLPEFHVLKCVGQTKYCQREKNVSSHNLRIVLIQIQHNSHMVNYEIPTEQSEDKKKNFPNILCLKIK